MCRPGGQLHFALYERLTILLARSIGCRTLAKASVTLVLVVPLLGCSARSDDGDRVPYPAKWVRRQIHVYETPSKRAESQVTHKVMYLGKPAYVIPSPCCDQFDYLYDAKGTVLCAPAGGFSGRGDGSCPEVYRSMYGKDP